MAARRGRNKLYGLAFSHPSLAARKMMERAGIEHEAVDLPGGVHPIALRLLGFPRGTVPALRLDGRRFQGSLEIARAIEARGPAGVLFPREPQLRRKVEEAERWGEEELQPIPRRLFRWALMRDRDLRRRLLRRSGVPLPGAAGLVMRPFLARLARASEADDDTVREDARRLPALLDRVDAWIAEGTIGGPEPNAADFQIGLTLSALLALEDYRDEVEGRPAADLARRLHPRYPASLPAVLPPEWRPRAG
ncbi:MAG TPA: glutathione S-transferase N-terminal domain-containing protein [Gemmatimonadota bacterium]|nr:glutathione S-transferase N-terminal domain-containing protein [Gemmatimonadota bacterium]